MFKQYEVSMEIAGPAAMFTRPDTGAAPVSSPVPSASAAKGIFESVAWLRTAYIEPTKLEICSEVRYRRYTTNYGGPLRKGNQIAAGAAYQHPAIILENVCYRLYGLVREHTRPPRPTNHLHALQEMFLRRLSKGQSYRTVCLGWSEFLPNYVGPLRKETQVNESLNLIIPVMLHSVFDQAVNGKPAPAFRQNVRVERGVMHYV